MNLSFEMGSIPEEAESKALYEEVYAGTSGIYQTVAEKASLDISPLHSLTESLVTYLAPLDQVVTDRVFRQASFLRVVMSATTTPQDWSSHAVHVATMAVKLAVGLGYSQEELTNLALSGLLHGVGMMSLPRSVLEQPGPLSSKQRSLIESHPILGAELLSELGEQFEWLQTVILQEHERYGGQGYPYKLSGKDIHEYARIIGLVDTFVSMTRPRPWRPAHKPSEVVKEIVNISEDEFDHRLVKLFLQKVTIFPVNSIVKLSNNEIGRVLAVHEDSPLRPTIEILHTHDEEHPVEPKILDLRKNLLLYVVDTISVEKPS